MQKPKTKRRFAAKKPPAKKTAAKKKPARVLRPKLDAPVYYGLYPAIVTNIVDPNRLGRIEVQLPIATATSKTTRGWATFATPYAGPAQGMQFMPDVGDQVVVAFGAGDLRAPFVLGACWNAKQTPPQSADAANNKKLLKSRAKSVFEFDDTTGAEKVTLATQSGHTLVLDNAAQVVRIMHANGSVITMTASGQIKIEAGASVEISAPALNAHCAVANFDGIVNCNTLIASTGVVSPSYTPGAGNVW
ncbi:MAG TPA: phage baseplate assembly protein V [Micropepsaceae bacterium]|nr:phage baseplate assembly protein V [Micropepsaceae bacterium]